MSELVVFDTNVFVSYLLIKTNKTTPIALAVDTIFDGRAIPVYTDPIIAEYDRVMHYAKFNFTYEKIYGLLSLVRTKGVCVEPISTDVHFIDITDKPFYDAALSAGAWLVTGNKRHYPQESFIVSPREYLERTGG